MAVTVSSAQWEAARTALQDTGARFTKLITTADPQAMATAHWTVGDTAAHVALIGAMNTWLTQGGRVPNPVPAVTERFSETNVDRVADLNVIALAGDPERDTRVLAERLDSEIAEILRATEDTDPATPIGWLGDAQVPLAGVLAHFANELAVHGLDIAKTAGVPWTIPSEDSARFFELFLVGMSRNGVGRLLETAAPPKDRRVAVEFRSRYTAPVTMVVDNGRVSIEAPGTGPDMHVVFDPTTFVLMLFGRVGRVRAVATGKVRMWGRRPWLLPEFLRIVRFPS